MADIRINALATTAASTASDDFIAVDGSANGTRKLNAYSPTFGGNLTVSGGILTLNNATESYVELKIAGTTKGYLDQLSSTLNVVGMSGVDVDIYAGGSNPANRVAKFAASGIATTLYGNLTVSGGTITGGTSGLSLASGGTNQNITLTPSGTGKVTVSNGTTAQPMLDITNTNTVPTKNGLRILGPNATSSSARQFALIANSIAYGDLELRRSTTNTGDPTSGDYIFGVSANGNFLIGTPTDSGAKLQIGTNTTTSAGGAVFGTDAFLYRSTSGYLTLESGLAGQVGLQIKTSGNAVATFGANATDLYVDAARAGGSMFLRTNGSTTALTLDSSQNATFAGTIVAVGNSTFKRSDNTGSIRIIPTSGVSAGSDIESFNASTSAYGRLNTRGTHLQVYTGTSANTLALTVDDSQNATFAGTISQTQAAAGSTANLKLNENGVRDWGFYSTGGKMSIRPSSAGTWSFNGNTDVELLRTTASTTTGSGALQVSGGVGVAGAVNVGTYYGMVDGVTAPAATSGYAKIYVDTADGDLKVIFGDGTIKTIATDT